LRVVVPPPPLLLKGGGIIFTTVIKNLVEVKMKIKLFVGNLSSKTTEADLNSLFAQAGTVASVELIKVEKTGNPNCFAFVDMNSQGEAEKAIGLLNGSKLNQKPLKVKIAKPREKRPAGGWYKDLPYSSNNHKGTSR
jgi:RNA recognition motif-containing protein